MRVAAVVALDVVVDHDLPPRLLARVAQQVDAMGVHLQVAEVGDAPAKVRLHVSREAREALGAVVEIDEDAVAEELEPDRAQPEVRLVEAGALRGEARRAQPAFAFEPSTRGTDTRLPCPRCRGARRAARGRGGGTRCRNARSTPSPPFMTKMFWSQIPSVT